MVMTDIILSVVLLCVGITVLVIIHICVVPAIRSGIGIGNLGGAQDDRETVHRARSETASGLSAEDLKMIPWFGYKDGEIIETSVVDCAVCLDGFKVGDKCRLLPTCHHCFHLECVDLWLMKKPFCPICRACVRPKKTSMVGDHSHESSLDVDQLA